MLFKNEPIWIIRCASLIKYPCQQINLISFYFSQELWKITKSFNFSVWWTEVHHWLSTGGQRCGKVWLLFLETHPVSPSECQAHLMMSMWPFLAARWSGLVPLGSVESPGLGSSRAAHMLLFRSSWTTCRPNRWPYTHN